MKKTQNVLDCLSFIDKKDLSSLELERLISELQDICGGKRTEEEKKFEEMEADKKQSFDSLNQYTIDDYLVPTAE